MIDPTLATLAIVVAKPPTDAEKIEVELRQNALTAQRLRHPNQTPEQAQRAQLKAQVKRERKAARGQNG